MNSKVKDDPVKRSFEKVREEGQTVEILIVGCLVSLVVLMGTPVFGKVFSSADDHSVQVIRER